MPFNPNQPRVPAGSDKGGEWTDEQINTVERAARKAAGLNDLNESISDIENRLALSSVENVVVVDKSGNTILSITGTENRTIIQKSDVEKLKGATVIHNHPTGTAPSIKDITSLHNTGANELRVVTKDKLYIIKPPLKQLVFNGPHVKYWPFDFDASYYEGQAIKLWQHETASGGNTGNNRGEFILKFVSKKVNLDLSIVRR